MSPFLSLWRLHSVTKSSLIPACSCCGFLYSPLSWLSFMNPVILLWTCQYEARDTVKLNSLPLLDLICVVIIDKWGINRGCLWTKRISPQECAERCFSHGRDSSSCWKLSSEMLVHIDMRASHSCCRFIDCTAMIWISSSIPKVLYWIESQRLWSFYYSELTVHVQETRWNDMSSDVFPAGSSRQKMGRVRSWRDGHGQQQHSCNLWCLNITQH